MNALRNFKYHQSKRAFPDELPPTIHSVRAHIMRAFYITSRMNSLLLPNRTLLVNVKARLKQAIAARTAIILRSLFFKIYKPHDDRSSKL